METARVEKVRSFIAIELAKPIVEALGRYQRKLRTRVELPVKWVNPEGIHLTLKFLGDVEVARVEAIREALGRAATGVRPFSITLGHPGAFPNVARPRVFWVGLEGDLPALTGLQRRVEEELGPMGFPLEDRAFQAHLTLGRVKEGGPRRAPFDARSLEALAWTSPVAQAVDRINLMKSELRPQGALYTRLAEIPL